MSPRSTIALRSLPIEAPAREGDAIGEAATAVTENADIPVSAKTSDDEATPTTDDGIAKISVLVTKLSQVLWSRCLALEAPGALRQTFFDGPETRSAAS